MGVVQFASTVGLKVAQFPQLLDVSGQGGAVHVE